MKSKVLFILVVGISLSPAVFAGQNTFNQTMEHSQSVKCGNINSDKSLGELSSSTNVHQKSVSGSAKSH